MASVGSTDSSTRLPMTALRPRNHYFLILLFTLLSFFPSIISSTASPLNPSSTSPLLSPPSKPTLNRIELEERVSKDRYPTPKSRSISNLESIRGFRFNAPSSPSSSLSEEPSFTSDSNEESGLPSSTFYDSEGSGGNSQGRNQEHKKKTTEYHEPTISDLTLLPLVLAVTVDGQVHALKRETGQWLWTLHDDGGSALGGSSRSRDTGWVSGPLVRGRGRKSSANAAMNSTSSRAGVTDLDFAGRRSGFREEVGEEEIEDEVYVIEPHSQGDIYLYSKDLTGEPASSSGGSLQKLPLSMQQLVALSPFTFPSDSSRMFVGRKETKLVGVDLKTGRLVGVFGSGAGWCEWDEKKVGRVKTEEECEDEIERRPEDLLYMARTEYHLSIYSKASASLLQTLTYTTYSSSSLGTALQSQWSRTPDARYLQPMHDGSLICFLSGVPGAQWTIAFEVPVVSIFDVAIPKSNDLDMNRKEEQPQPMIFEQPHPLPVEGLPLDFDKLHVLPEATFIGRIQGELFAMSKENFPLVAFAPLNGIDSAALEGITAGDESDGSGLGGRCRGPGCLIGRHRVIPSEITPVENTIDAPEARLGIDAPPISNSPSLDSTKSSPYPPNRSSVLSSINAPLSKLSESNSTALVLFLLAVIGYLYLKKMGTGKDSKSDSVSSKNGQQHWIDPARTNASSTFSRDTLDASLPPTPITATADLTPIPAVAEVEDLLTAPTPELLVPAITPLGLLPQLEIVPQPPEVLQALRPRSETLTDPRPRSGSFTLSPSPSAFKELPPLPLDDGAEEGDGESGDDQNKENAEGTPRKKGRRRRGKKTKKNGGVKALEDLLAIDGLVTEKELIGLTLGEPELVADADMSLVVAVAADPHLIGGLSVSDTILGYGSHGTVVLRGEFQGRAVAVKRLLKDFVTIATHEVALLQESDDHPHVIRYFCKEQRDTFLYIALELCPASLYDLIDQPSTFPDLARDFDPKKALRQITGGIRHLHKLKIVHRDIKPQNILVSTSKLGGVRMLISDFGLCKKLDMDESSFQQTVNHAAGSFGYRAPEVLRGQVDPNGGASTPSNSTVDSRHGRESSTGSGTNTDPSMRLTRSIDIFSLGCIFYYVLTGGEHPFGGRYEREMNILNGKLSLDRLDGLGEEALEVQDLITRMVATDPRERPSADSVLLHPFFWNAQKRLLFICDASDRFEIMERDPPTATLLSLEDSSEVVVGEDWQKSIDKTLLDNLGKYRKYDGKSVRDLLRVLRNKKHHYQDLPESVRNHLGDLPGGFLSYFTTRFPHLLLHVYDTVSTHLSDEPMFESTFKIPEDEQ